MRSTDDDVTHGRHESKAQQQIGVNAVLVLSVLREASSLRLTHQRKQPIEVSAEDLRPIVVATRRRRAGAASCAS